MATAFYLCDEINHVIRSVNTSGVINAFSPTYPHSLSSPQGICFDNAGNLYICNEGSNYVFKVIPSLGATVVAGTGTGSGSLPSGLATSANIGVSFCATDAAGNLYLSLVNAQCVAVVNMQATTQTLLNVSVPAGHIAVVAGNGSSGFSGDGGAAVSAELNDPIGICVDPTGNLFIIDSENWRVRRVDHATGVITTCAGTGVGGNDGYSGDGGLAVDAAVGQMRGICCDANGNIYLGCALAFNNYSVIRAVNMTATTQTILTVSIPAGCINTVVGSVGNGNGFAGDGDLATNPAVKLSVITWALSIDPSGNLIFDDFANYRIREVNASTGIINTVCGTGTSGSTGNGGAATSARIGELFGLAAVLPIVSPPVVSPTSLSFVNGPIWAFYPAVGDGVAGFGTLGPSPLTITTSGDWTVSSETGMTWVSQSSGSGNSIIQVAISSDFDFPLGYSNRIKTGTYVDTLIITSGGGSTTVPISFGVGYGDLADGQPNISHGMVIQPQS